MVLEKMFGMSATDIYAGKADALSLDERARLSAALQRLMESEPVQYVLGVAEFGMRDFIVRRGVLIPRPETFQLTRIIVDEKFDSSPAILDIGTGSGCIAVTLAADISGARVTAWDVSSVALDVCLENAKLYGVQVDAVEQDALLPPTDESVWDIIVSNPPYVCEGERSDMDDNVLDYEPELALFVPDEDPLKFYRPIASYARRSLKPGGTLYLEINPDYAVQTARLLMDNGFAYVDIREDDFGRKRFIVCANE